MPSITDGCDEFKVGFAIQTGQRGARLCIPVARPMGLVCSSIGHKRRSVRPVAKVVTRFTKTVVRPETAGMIRERDGEGLDRAKTPRSANRDSRLSPGR